jgi:hypothetical protein
VTKTKSTGGRSKASETSPSCGGWSTNFTNEPLPQKAYVKILKINL